ncbi:MAG TPA: SipW-dependent-type signal peptide-containing protein [Nocardioides sp.]|uniref:SipW-dependent-type signal peptide-containing protein n=1 Tax=Nocardioides sp. TaxID=35761 RepID=UPI002F412A2E
MAFSRKVITAGAVGVAALALIGTGAGASFTDAVHARQTITAGTVDVQITNGGGGTVSGDRKTVILPAFGPTGSTFETDQHVITITNKGTVPATAAAIQMTESHADTPSNNALFSETNVCIQSTDYSGGPWTEGNGPLTTAVALNPTVEQNPVVLKPGDSMTFSVEFYAGQDSSYCKPIYSDGSHTAAAWAGQTGGPYSTPPSLNNDAQGGTITPTMTFSFTG